MKRIESVRLVQFLLYEQQELQLGEITGIFGPNGSGKSSALDAVQIAMFGANKNLLAFNAQADSGQRQQNRTLRSYCLGQYGDAADQCVRSQATTYITLVWRDTATNEPTSMGVCIEASADAEGERVVGRYVIRGVELMMSEHLQAVDGVTAPLPWSSFRHRLLERSKVTGEDPLFDDASTYVKQVLFTLRGQAGVPSYDAFARAFRFALRMRFDKSLDQIVRQDVLENRPTNIQKFKAIVDTFKRLKAKIQWVEEKIAKGKTVATAFDLALTEARRSATWHALDTAARHEAANAGHEALAQRLEEAKGDAERATRDGEAAAEALVTLDQRIDHLQRLQEAHSDHSASSSAQMDREAAQKRASVRYQEFDKEIAAVLKLVANAAAAPYAADWCNELTACADRLKAAQPADSTHGPDFLRRALSDLAAVAKAALRGLEKPQKELDEKAAAARTRIQLIKPALERVRSGHAEVSDRTQYLMIELREKGLSPTPVCDLVTISDPDWQPAIEAYLASNVEAPQPAPGSSLLAILNTARRAGM